MTRWLAALSCLAALITAVSFSAPTSASHAAPSSPAATDSGAPVFAYYYIWFSQSSWNRAKMDYPAVGRYSSDDANVMREQIEQAKAAGISGFMVSWKDTTTNDRRLRTLMKVAARENFRLGMVYQGLDFSRHPLPVSKVAADFVTFRNVFAPNPVFYRLGGKVLTAFSGTWEYSHADVARVTGPVRNKLLVLSMEKTVSGYHRLADVTDGDAYYWSSVNPGTNPNYESKLQAMSSAVHADGKYWIAPFAPGFDARMVGGSNSVPRDNGQTLRTEYANALRSSPDILGLISWNEFSENSYVEPSVHYGHRFLDVLSELRHTAVPASPSSTDSSSQAGGKSGPNRMNLVVLIGLPLALVLLVGMLAHRRRRNDPPRRPPSGGNSVDSGPLIRPGRH